MSNNNMTNQLSAKQISKEIKEIYTADAVQAEQSIETYLELMLKELPIDQKLTFLGEIKTEFQVEAPPPPPPEETEKGGNELGEFFSLLLGRDVPTTGLSSSEMMQRLSDSLNTIFNSLNELVSAINNSILSDYSKDETIRQIISYHLGDDLHLEAMVDYIGRIKSTFLTTQDAFKSAAKSTVENILDELDPEKIKSESEGKFSFGPIKKAQHFNVYEKKYDRFKKWFESGNFMESFLREFEKNCHKQTKR